MSKVTWNASTATSCQLKWTWSKLFLQRGVTQCCWHNPHHPLDGELKDFHNTQLKISDRELMLKGEWPAGCGYCKNLESRGGISDRILHNQIPDIRPIELVKDPLATHIDPTIIEIIFSNTCNLSCVYCGPELSSTWNNELAKHGDIVLNDSAFRKYVKYDKTTYSNNVDKFWEWMKEKSNSLRKLTALGGEPVLEENTYKLIDFFEGHPNPELQFLLFTNLAVPRSKLELALTKLSKLVESGKLKSVQVWTSLECWGPSAEYIRYGLDLVEWEQNLCYTKTFPNVDLLVNGTITCLSAKTMPDLIRRLKELDVEFHFAGVDRMPMMELGVLPADLIINEINESIELLPQWQADRLRGIRTLLEPAGDIDKMRTLRKYLDELSARRNLKWQEAFPWLTETLENVL